MSEIWFEKGSVDHVVSDLYLELVEGWPDVYTTDAPATTRAASANSTRSAVRTSARGLETVFGGLGCDDKPQEYPLLSGDQRQQTGCLLTSGDCLPEETFYSLESDLIKCRVTNVGSSTHGRDGNRCRHFD